MYDLTHPLTPDIPRVPGDPEVRIDPIDEFAPWRISALAMGTHSGTHMDAPLHRIRGGAGIGDFGPERLLGRGLVIDVSGRDDDEGLPASALDGAHQLLWPGWFAVLHTGWDQYWRGERYFRHPYVSPALAHSIVDSGAGLLAIDTLSIDSTVDAGSAAREIVLGAGVLVVENLCNLAVLQPLRQYGFAFLPLALTAVDGSPARVIAWHLPHPSR